jgi:hypothetical protein
MTLEKCMPARAGTSDTDSYGDAIKFQYYSALFKIRYVLCSRAYRQRSNAPVDRPDDGSFGESGMSRERRRECDDLYETLNSTLICLLLLLFLLLIGSCSIFYPVRALLGRCRCPTFAPGRPLEDVQMAWKFSFPFYAIFAGRL